MARMIVGNTLFYKITFYHPYTKNVFDPDNGTIFAKIYDISDNSLVESIPITTHEKTTDTIVKDVVGVYLFSHTPTKKGTFKLRIESKLNGLSSVEESTFTITD